MNIAACLFVVAAWKYFSTVRWCGDRGAHGNGPTGHTSKHIPSFLVIVAQAIKRTFDTCQRQQKHARYKYINEVGGISCNSDMMMNISPVFILEFLRMRILRAMAPSAEQN